MKHPLLQRALDSLAHPVSIGAAGLLLLNALVLQPIAPSWWTGKVGDFAWLVIAPSVAVCAVGIFLPANREKNSLWGERMIVLTGLVYALVKSNAPSHAFVVAAISKIGFTPKLLLDPSDLIALPALVLPWLIWKDRPLKTRHTMLRGGALAFAALALAADSPGPVPPEIVCLIQRDQIVEAYTQGQSPNYFGGDPNLYWSGVYSSNDGGTIWSRTKLTTKEERQQTLDCSQVTWPVGIPSGDDAAVQLYFVDGKGIYASEDAGKNLHLEKEIPKVYSALVDPTSGNLILAAGTHGIFIRTLDGQWSQPVNLSE